MKNLYVSLPEQIGTIDPNIYGQFSEHIGGVFYDGLWVGEDSDVPNIKGFRRDIIEKLRAIHIPVLRWPGGCFAETYNWRDGIGPREQRPVRPQWWTGRDGRMESNAVGTHEFVTLCRLVGAEPYFAANITSMTPLDIRDWMDYCNSARGTTALAREREANGSPEPFNIKYWGIGNETWGGGGEMTPEYYAHEYRRYAAVLANLTDYLGGELFVSGTNAFDADWARRCLGELRDVHCAKFSGYTLHYYCSTRRGPDRIKLECRGFTPDEWYEILWKGQRTQEVIDRSWGFIVGYGMEQKARLVIDEWGAWYKDGSGPSKGYNLFEQQSTMRDAVLTGLSLNIFQNNCEKIRMANVAQLVNNLHCMFLASGKNCVATPAYHVFDMYQGHMGGTAVRTAIENPAIAFRSVQDGSEQKIQQFSSSASVKDGVLTVTLTNASLDADETVALNVVGGKVKGQLRVRTLHCGDPDTVNDFEHPDAVTPTEAKWKAADGIPVPPASVVSIEVKLA